ncbi:MAG: MHS family MFS transporter [Saprospiraceae bacterium]|nr:MHS family MFS transporter [Saprospiraceae bacterium]
MSKEQLSGGALASVIASSSVGTLIEWYDFYIFGSLAKEISTQFFPSDNPTAAFLSTLATFAAGFIVRPFGALFFGRLGDLIGRKYTFLVTLLIMGGATFIIGCIPGYKTIGALAPALVLILRLLQGLALGGEYGGAATYVAEHSPEDKRGFWTSWIQTTATVGLFVSLIVIIICRNSMTKEAFADWGWRIPFWLSIIMVGISVVIRMRMNESPLFAKLKSEGKTSKNPLAESFGKKENFKMVLLALFGATCGQGVVWYTGQFYAMNFLKGACAVEAQQAETWLGIAFLLATPFFVVFATLSDKMGRKWIMLAGMLLSILTTKPLFEAMKSQTDPKKKTEIAEKMAVGAPKIAASPKNALDSLMTTDTTRYYTDGTSVKKVTVATLFADSTKRATAKPTITSTVKLGDSNKWSIIGIVFILVLYVTMAYGPIAAFLVELFPTRIRYTSMSLPYHIGNGVFGGLVPFIGALLVEYSPTKDIYAGLNYPIGVTILCFVIGLVFMPNKPVADD